MYCHYASMLHCQYAESLFTFTVKIASFNNVKLYIISRMFSETRVRTSPALPYVFINSTEIYSPITHQTQALKKKRANNNQLGSFVK